MQQIYYRQMLRSQMEQELFRALSNRTRTKPNEIYSKMTSQIVNLQQQIIHFNQLESQIPNWLKRETNKLGGQPKNLSLKMMTQPKYQNLLINCDLPQGDKQNLKNNKMVRKLSQKANIKNSSYKSTAKSFNLLGLGSKVPNQSSNLFFGDTFDSKMIAQVQSATINVLPQKNMPTFKNRQKQQNISITQSIVFPEKQQEATPQFSRSRPLSIRQQVIKKQRLLENQWEKTQRYHQKMSKWMGQEQAQKITKTMCPNSRLVGVIQKIRNNRPQTSRLLQQRVTRTRIKSQQL